MTIHFSMTSVELKFYRWLGGVVAGIFVIWMLWVSNGVASSNTKQAVNEAVWTRVEKKVDHLTELVERRK